MVTTSAATLGARGSNRIMGIDILDTLSSLASTVTYIQNQKHTIIFLNEQYSGNFAVKFLSTRTASAHF